MTLRQRPLSIADANDFVGLEHRHCGEVVGGKFAIGAFDGDILRGVAIVGRTTDRALHDPVRAEVTRLATDGTFNTCSFLYAKARRVAQAMGYESLKTYNLADESGSSLKAVGACCEADLEARSWSKASKSRPREDKSTPAARRRYELIHGAPGVLGRPVMRYHGGKWRIAPWIISHFPEHSGYIEPYGGGASVLLRKPRVELEVYNDLDSELVNAFRVLRDPALSEQLRHAVTLTPYARAEYELSYLSSVDPVERARRTIFRAYGSFGGTGIRRHRTGMRRSMLGRGNHPELDWRGWPSAVPALTSRLTGVFIEQCDAIELIARYDHPDNLFYVDPPYPHSTRSAVQSAAHYHYTAEMTDEDHRRLAGVLARLRGAVVLSGYACTLYDEELYRGWHRYEKKARANGGADRVEVLWIKPAGIEMDAPLDLLGHDEHTSTPTLFDLASIEGEKTEEPVEVG
jgi:DNA adenine methylase